MGDIAGRQKDRPQSRNPRQQNLTSGNPAGVNNNTLTPSNQGSHFSPPKQVASCWDTALAKLKSERKHSETYKKLMSFGQGNDTPKNIARSAEQKVQRLQEKDWRLLMPATRLDPSGGATLACGGIFAIVQVALNDTKQCEFAINSVLDIAPIVERWTYYETRSIACDSVMVIEIPERLKDGLVDLYVDIMSYLVKMAKHCEHSTSRRFVGAFASKLDEWTIQRDRIKTKDGICKSYRDNQEAERNFQKQNAELLHWISATDWSFEHQEVLRETQVGTDYAHCGQWLLDSEEYQRWRDGQSSKIIWLRGAVGTGKTTLMARIVQDLQEFPLEQAHLALHYCSTVRGSGKTLGTASVLSSIVRQMAWVPKTASVATPILEIYERFKLNRRTDGNLSVDICTNLIKDIAQDAQKSHPASFIIIIDALDECEEAAQLLKSLTQATKICNNVYFVFSSRLNVRIPRYFAAVTQVYITPEKTSDDMMFFIRNYISTKDEPLPGPNPSELEEKLFRLLEEKANGMFRWTQMQLEEFLSSCMSRPRLRTTGEANEKLEKLRKRTSVGNLDTEYERIYSQNTTPGSESWQHAIKAYKLLLCCFEPLALSELVQAVSLNDDGSVHPEVCEDYILEICSNFVVVTHKNVRFAHASAKEYLQSREENHRQEFSSENQHLQAALSCLNCAKNFGTLTEEALTRNLRRPYGFSEDWAVYAADFWLRHAQIVSITTRTSRRLSNKIAAFVSSPAFQDWSRLERAAGAMHNLGLMHHCLVQRSGSSATGIYSDPIFFFTASGFAELLEPKHICKKMGQHCINLRGETLLHVACVRGHTEIIKLILEKCRGNFDINATNKQHETALLRLAWDSRKPLSTDMMTLFLRHGADPSKKSRREITFSGFILEQGRLDAVRILIAHAKTIKMDYRHMILSDLDYWKFQRYKHNTWGKDAEDLLQFLRCEVGLDDNSQKLVTGKDGDPVGSLVLSQASAMGDIEFLQRWRRAGLSIDVTDLKGSTLLHVAGKPETVDYLLKLDGSLLKKRDGSGKTPLLRAFRWAHPAVCRRLRDYGGSAEDKDNFGRTALHSFLRLNPYKFSHQEGLEWLIEKGLAGRKDKAGNISLHYLRCPGDATKIPDWSYFISRLLESGERLLVTNNKGLTAAEVAIYFMEEMRLEERKKKEDRSLDDEKLDILRFLCHQLRERAKYNDAKAEKMIRKDGERRNEALLAILQKHKESGWKLPLPMDRKTRARANIKSYRLQD